MVSFESLHRIRDENEKLPKNVDGQIMSPRFVPVGSSYLSLWRLYLRQTPKSEWPSWLVADLRMMKPHAPRR